MSCDWDVFELEGMKNDIVERDLVKYRWWYGSVAWFTHDQGTGDQHPHTAQILNRTLRK